MLQPAEEETAAVSDSAAAVAQADRALSKAITDDPIVRSGREDHDWGSRTTVFAGGPVQVFLRSVVDNPA